MGIPVPNIDQAETWQSGAPILGPGRHVVRIDEATDDTLSSQGNPQIELKLSNGEGRISDWLVVLPAGNGSQGTFGKVRQLFEAAGVELPSGPDAVLRAAPLVGKTLAIYVANGAQGAQQSRDDIPF
jgi:hypothetical protein